jgi:hypothetical protein
MTFESFSGILVCVVLVAFVLWWFPTHASQSMKNATRHSGDRFSESMRIIDVDAHHDETDDTPRSGGLVEGISQVGDAVDGSHNTSEATVIEDSPATRQSEQLPATMPSTSQGKPGKSKGHASAEAFDNDTVRAIRQARRKAFKRRRIVVGVLCAATVVTLAVMLALHYSPAWALIPVAMLAAVLGCGIHASSKARAWERRLALYKAQRRAADGGQGASAKSHEFAHSGTSGEVNGAPRPSQPSQPSYEDRRADASVRYRHDEGVDNPHLADSTPTVKMDTRQISQAIHSEEPPVDVLHTSLSFTLGAADSEQTSAVRSAEIKSYRQVAKAVPRRGMTEQIRKAAQREAAEASQEAKGVLDASEVSHTQGVSQEDLDRDLQQALERHRNASVMSSATRHSAR